MSDNTTIKVIDANTARMKAEEARLQAEAYALENAQELLDHIYAEIQRIAESGGERYFTWLEETEESVRFAELLREDSDITELVALEGRTLLEKPAGPYAQQPTLLGRALLKHLQDAGYKASLNTFPGGQLVVSWGDRDEYGELR